MKQTKLESLVESIFNTSIGFIISLLVWVFIVTPLWDIKVSHVDNIMITIIFTVTSIMRSYFVRRFFNAELHKLAIKFAKVFKKGS